MSALKTLYQYLEKQCTIVTDQNAHDILHSAISAEITYNGVGSYSGKAKLPYHMPFSVTKPNAKHIARLLLISDVNDAESHATMKRVELEDGKCHTLPQKDPKIQNYFYKQSRHVLKNADKCMDAFKRFKTTDHIYLSSRDSMPHKVTAEFVRKLLAHDLDRIGYAMHKGKPEQMNLFATV